jgi:hypothetical protein
VSRSPELLHEFSLRLSRQLQLLVASDACGHNKRSLELLRHSTGRHQPPPHSTRFAQSASASRKDAQWRKEGGAPQPCCTLELGRLNDAKLRRAALTASGRRCTGTRTKQTTGNLPGSPNGRNGALAIQSRSDRQMLMALCPSKLAAISSPSAVHCLEGASKDP